MLSSRNIQYGHLRNGSTTTNADAPASSSASPSTSSPTSSRPNPRPSYGHFRSRSYLSGLTSPIDPKPRNAVSMPLNDNPAFTGNVSAEKAGTNDGDESSTPSLLPRLHFPGHGHKNRHSHDLKHGLGVVMNRVPNLAGTGAGAGAGAGTGNGIAAGGKEHHLHFLGRAHSHHRHTRSEAQWPGADSSHSGWNEAFLYPGSAVSGGKAGSSMITRVTSNLSSKSVVGVQQKKPHHQHSASDFHRAWGPIPATVVSGAGSGRPEVRRRATSDPRAPPYGPGGVIGSGRLPAREGVQPQFGPAHFIDGSRARGGMQRPMSEIEILLLKAERAREEAERNLSDEQVDKLSMQLAESNIELQQQLDGTSRTAADLTRRLDDAFSSLTSTASSLIDTISSFQTLFQQSRAQSQNFESKTKELDDEVRLAIEKHRAALFEERGTKIANLELRGKRANERAEEMSRRLENCRTMVKNYVEQQHTKQRAWKGVLVGSIYGFGVILFGILLGFGIWWYKNYGDIGRHDVYDAVALTLDGQGLRPLHGQLHDVVKERWKDTGHGGIVDVLENVPADVRKVLEDIRARHVGPEANATSSLQYVKAAPKGPLEDDHKLLQLLDELER